MTITFTQEEYEMLMRYAIQYCAGRQTCMPSLILEIFKKNEQKIRRSYADILSNDLETKIAYKSKKLPLSDRRIWEEYVTQLSNVTKESSDNTFELEQNDAETLIVCALRAILEIKTTIADSEKIVKAIENHKSEISENRKNIYIRDIQDGIEFLYNYDLKPNNPRIVLLKKLLNMLNH